MFDARISELSDYRTTILAPTWDCKIPLNVNDFDLRPEMKEPPLVQGKVTEGIFTLLRCEIGEFIRHSSFHLDFTNPSLKAVAKDLPGGGNFDTLEKMIEKGYLDHCDSHNPLHFMTIWMMRCTLSKYRLLQYYSQCYSGPQTKRQNDTAMLYAFRVLESDTRIMSSPLTKGYRWLLLSYFPLPAYIHIVQELIKQPTRPEAKQAWEVMSDNYEVRFTAASLLGSHIFKTFAKIILQAWEALEKAWKDSERENGRVGAERGKQQHGAAIRSIHQYRCHGLAHGSSDGIWSLEFGLSDDRAGDLFRGQPGAIAHIQRSWAIFISICS
jgi:hypothetical protein